MDTSIYQMFENLIPIHNSRKVRLDGDFAIILTPSLQVVYLNEVAKSFLNLVNGERSIADIIQALMSSYDVDIELLKKDVVELVRNLQWEQVIQVKGARPC